MDEGVQDDKTELVTCKLPPDGARMFVDGRHYKYVYAAGRKRLFYWDGIEWCLSPRTDIIPLFLER